MYFYEKIPMRLFNLYKILRLDPLDQSLIYFKQCLVHDSYNSDAAKNNSRFVFSGMFAFRGDVADLLINFLPGRGQELQHVLGQIMKNEKLEKLFDQWELDKFIKVKEIDYKRLKHIFVYAILGYIHIHQEKKFITDFILKHIITEKDIDDLWKDKFKFSLRNELDYFAAKRYHSKVLITEFKNEDKTTTVTLDIGGKLLKTHTSKSGKYAVKKVMKDALKEILNDAISVQEKEDTLQKEMNARKAKEERIIKHKKIQERNQQKKDQRIFRKNEKSIIALQKTEKIRKNAMLKKQKRIERERLLLEKSRRPISGKKQRFLQDKLK